LKNVKTNLFIFLCVSILETRAQDSSFIASNYGCPSGYNKKQDYPYCVRPGLSFDNTDSCYSISEKKYLACHAITGIDRKKFFDSPTLLQEVVVTATAKKKIIQDDKELIINGVVVKKDDPRLKIVTDDATGKTIYYYNNSEVKKDTNGNLTTASVKNGQYNGTPTSEISQEQVNFREGESSFKAFKNNDGTFTRADDGRVFRANGGRLDYTGKIDGSHDAQGIKDHVFSASSKYENGELTVYHKSGVESTFSDKGSKVLQSREEISKLREKINTEHLSEVEKNKYSKEIKEAKKDLVTFQASNRSALMKRYGVEGENTEEVSADGTRRVKQDECSFSKKLGATCKSTDVVVESAKVQNQVVQTLNGKVAQMIYQGETNKYQNSGSMKEMYQSMAAANEKTAKMYEGIGKVNTALAAVQGVQAAIHAGTTLSLTATGRKAGDMKGHANVYNGDNLSEVVGMDRNNTMSKKIINKFDMDKVNGAEFKESTQAILAKDFNNKCKSFAGNMYALVGCIGKYYPNAKTQAAQNQLQKAQNDIAGIAREVRQEQSAKMGKAFGGALVSGSVAFQMSQAAKAARADAQMYRQAANPNSPNTNQVVMDPTLSAPTDQGPLNGGNAALTYSQDKEAMTADQTLENPQVTSKLGAPGAGGDENTNLTDQIKPKDVALANGSVGGGGGGGLSSGGAIPGGGASHADKEPKAEMADSSNPNQKYDSGGGSSGGAYGGGKGVGGSDPSIDLNSMLAQFMPKAEDEKKDDEGILEVGFRKPASAVNESGSFLDKNADIFQRIHQTYQDKHGRGAVGI
jgi:hypothetical protein